jgi:NAD(P)-dependent dehydrogenase (short-subunit alcohol dehydrogenase family)
MSGQSSLPAALVTGAAGGIGAAIVDRFIERGLRVLAVDRDAPGLAALQRRSPQHAAVVAACIDVADPHAMNSAVAVFGELDFAVLNAGIEGRVAPVDVYPSADFEEVMRVNVRGVWCGMQSVIPTLERRGAGGIVIISSISGMMGFPGVAAYTAAKHAVIGIMRSAALELASQRIRVNVVAPGFVSTRMTQDLERQLNPADPPAAHEAARQRTPLQRYAEPTEIAAVVNFLASDTASFCTGGVYAADGGFST